MVRDHVLNAARLTVCLVLLWLLTSSALAATGFRPDRILVQLKPGVPAAAISRLHADMGAKPFGTAGRHLQVLTVTQGTSVPELLAKYRRSVLVEFAEPDYVRRTATTRPNDPKFLDGTLWYLNNYGQNSGTPGADIHASQAWDIATSAPEIVVAVLDSGIQYTHEDLAANMWKSPVDGSHGWNALTHTTTPTDSSGHGTILAGVLGAVGNNGKGVVGVAWGVQIMACTCFDANGNGSDSDIIACLDFARTNGARIINASWGSYSNSLALSNAIYELRQEGILFVASAGNDAKNIDVNPYYPACYHIDNIVPVAYSTKTDSLGTFSNFGRTNVLLAAPGAAMYSTFFGSDNSYLGSTYLEGTSFAAPIVSGALALLLGQHPAETHQEIILRLFHATDAVSGLYGRCVTGGRLNLEKALNPPILLNATTSLEAMRLQILAEPGKSIIVEASSDLLQWSPVQTNTSAANWASEYLEPRAIKPAARFYRAVAKP